MNMVKIIRETRILKILIFTSCAHAEHISVVADWNGFSILQSIAKQDYGFRNCSSDNKRYFQCCVIKVLFFSLAIWYKDVLNTHWFVFIIILKLLKIFELDFHIVICARGANLGKYFSLKILKTLNAHAIHMRSKQTKIKSHSYEPLRINSWLYQSVLNKQNLNPSHK